METGTQEWIKIESDKLQALKQQVRTLELRINALVRLQYAEIAMLQRGYDIGYASNKGYELQQARQKGTPDEITKLAEYIDTVGVNK
jgi:hypothetical protein